MEQNVDYASLYEFLGRRGGLELGQQVYQEAKKQKIKCISREIKQGGYEGKVMVYPISFLQEYFTQPSINNDNYPIN